MPTALYALVLAAFAIGTTEFVVMGLLPDVALDLGVGIPHAGLLVSGYAMGVVVGGPLLAVATASMQKKRALTLLFALFISGNVLCAMAPGYTTLMVARIITAFAHGTFLGVAAVVAMQLVPKRRHAEAIGYIFTGIVLANVIGVPVGIALGHAFGWRSAFWAVAALAAAALALLRATLPPLPQSANHSIGDEVRALGNVRLLTALALSVACSATLLCLFTYITPFLQQVTAATPTQVTQILVVFGIGLSVGTTCGGMLGHLHLWRLIAAGLGIAMVVLLAMPYLGHFMGPCVLGLFIWGTVSFGLCPILQSLILSHAEAAPTLAATLTHSAFNLGNATGAWVGALALSYGQPIAQLPWTCVGLSVLALMLVALSAHLGPSPAHALVDPIVGSAEELQ